MRAEEGVSSVSWAEAFSASFDNTERIELQSLRASVAHTDEESPKLSARVGPTHRRALGSVRPPTSD